MKVAVLGAGGCFAQNFVRALADEGIESFGIGRSIKSRPFWHVPKDFRFVVLHLVNDFEKVIKYLDVEKPEIIVNFAAQGEGAASFEEKAPDFFNTNTTALVRIVLGIRGKGYLQRFIQIGSSEVYGSVREPATEATPLSPTSPYSISKAAFDQYLVCMHKVHGFPMNIMRPSNCYTDGQQLYRIIPKTILCALKKEKLLLHGGGIAEKSYLHADDLSSAVIRIIRDAPLGEIYNVGPNQPIAIRGLVSLLAKILGVAYSDLVEDAPDRTGQDRRYALDCGKIKELGWEEKVKLWPGLHKMVDWVQSYPELLTMPTEYIHRQ